MLEIFGPYSLLFWIIIISLVAVVIAMASRPFLTHAKFAYPNALFEAIGNPYIEEKELSSIVDSKNLHTFKETLNTLKNYNIEGEDTQSIQSSLDDNFIKTIEMMRKGSSKKMKDFYDMYLEKIDIYIVKNELKKLILNKEKEVEIDNALLPKTKDFLTKLKDAEKESLPEILSSYGFDKELIELISETNIDVLSIDVDIDKYIIKKLTEVGVPYKCEQANLSFVKSMIDVMNIKNILRAKQLGYDAATCKKLCLGDGKEIAIWKFNEMAEVDKVPQVISSIEGTSYFDILKDYIEEYNKEGSVQVLENALDGFFLKIIKDISLNNFLNLGPTIRFLVSKEFEIKNLKVIAKGIGENFSSDLIKELLIKGVT